MERNSSYLQNIESNIKGVAWPPLLSGSAATLSVILRQLEESQWWKPEEILAKQMRQLALLSNHCYQYSAQFKERMICANLKPRDLLGIGGLAKLPPLTRQDIKFSKQPMFCTNVPDSHKPICEDSTSGSTGEPLVIRKTVLNSMLWLAITMREHFWNKRDFSKRLMVITADVEELQETQTWGEPVDLLFPSGRVMSVNITTDIKEQIKYIKEFRPAGLLTYPNNLAGLIDECEKENISLDGIEYLWSISETVSAQLRQRARKFFGVEIHDNYSSTELGVIAIQCPTSGLYHIMAENVLVEVLNEHGAPCKVGEIGKIVATALHNFAMPLIRYEIGDYAEVGPPCSCGRGLPTLKAIHGRSRNLLTLPDGTRHWPTFLKVKVEEFPAIRQFQFIQNDLYNIELKIFSDKPLHKDDEEKLRLGIQESFGYKFNVTFSYFNKRLPVNANGKFEEFICMV